MIEPNFVTFEQAKLLKELGMFPGSNDKKEWKGLSFRGAYRLDGTFYAPQMIRISNINHFLAPEQWYVLEWLRVVKGIYIFLDYTYYDGFICGFKWVKEANGAFEEVWLDREPGNILSYAELYSKAFDHILTKLKNGEIR